MHVTNPLLFEAVLGFKIMAMHVHGAHNILADKLSCDNLQSFLSKVPMMETTPTLVPAPILRNLLFNIVNETLRKHSKRPATDQVRYTLLSWDLQSPCIMHFELYRCFLRQHVKEC